MSEPMTVDQIEPGRRYRIPEHPARFVVDQVLDNGTVLYRPDGVNLASPLALPATLFAEQFRPSEGEAE